MSIRVEDAVVRRVDGVIVFDNRFGWIGDASSGSLICQACGDVLPCAEGASDADADAHWHEMHASSPDSPAPLSRSTAPARLSHLTAAARLGVQ